MSIRMRRTLGVTFCAAFGFLGGMCGGRVAHADRDERVLESTAKWTRCEVHKIGLDGGTLVATLHGSADKINLDGGAVIGPVAGEFNEVLTGAARTNAINFCDQRLDNWKASNAR